MTDTKSMTGPDFAAARRAMVDSQLRTSGVTDVRLLAAMGRIPRELFLPETSRASAYIDRSLPIDGGRAVNPPMTTARLIDAAAIAPDDRVLLIGAGSGYALAVVAALCSGPVAVESDAMLADAARANVPDARVETGPLEQGAPAHGPFDAIIIDGAVEHVPDAIVAQLRPDGRLATARVDRGVTRLAIGRRGGTGFGLADFADAEAVILPGFARPRSFVF